MSLILELQHLSGSLSGESTRIALEEGQVVRLGRSPQSDVKFNDELDDSVSSVHADLGLEDGRLWVEDQRSTNGTYVNGSPCPPFQRLAVPDGARLRLGKSGPEMQITLREARAAAPSPGRSTVAESGAGATAGAAATAAQATGAGEKRGVGRDTLLREIDRARDEERDHVQRELQASQSSNRTWLVAAAAALLLLVGAAGWGLYSYYQGRLGETEEQLQATIDEVETRAARPWSEIESAVAPAVAHVRCRYLLRLPQGDGRDSTRLVQVPGGEAVGSAVLIGPDLLLTARHVVEPWKSAFSQPWEEVAKVTGLTTAYDLLEVQFPGQQPISATVLAVAENKDLALLSIGDRVVEPVRVADSNGSVKVTDEVAILSYPQLMGKSTLFQLDRTVLDNRRVVTVSDMQPTFLRGTVSLPVTTSGDRAGLFFLDASVEPGSSGGAVVNRDGDLIGIISQRLEVAEEIEMLGETFTMMQEIGGSVQAVNPDDIQAFLKRAGVL